MQNLMNAAYLETDISVSEEIKMNLRTKTNVISHFSTLESVVYKVYK